MSTQIITADEAGALIEATGYADTLRMVDRAKGANYTRFVTIASTLMIEGPKRSESSWFGVAYEAHCAASGVRPVAPNIFVGERANRRALIRTTDEHLAAVIAICAAAEAKANA